MVSLCEPVTFALATFLTWVHTGAALATEPSASTELLQSTVLPALLQLDNTLHQLDIRGDSTGWFQSGLDRKSVV